MQTTDTPNKELSEHSMRPLYFIERHKRILLRILSVIVLLFVVLYALFIGPPHDFATKHTVTVPPGTTLNEAATLLKEERIIRSAWWYKVFNVLSGNQSRIQAGDYYFHTPASLFEVTARLTTADYGLTPMVTRIPEGATIFSIADLMESQFERFDKEKFIERALKEEAEGYLFPDTYYFLPNVTEKEVYQTLRETFDTRIETIASDIEAFGKPLEDIVIMASLIEKEAADDFEERQTIAGILWSRIDIGMALQVDAVFPYINGKNTYELSLEDLEIDSPYNTYKYPGLPIGPIANPSLESILAAVTPIDTDYLFYLHDRAGNIYYSITFENHRENKFRYLR